MKTPTLFCCRLIWLYPLLFGQLHYTMLPVHATQREEGAREIKGKLPIVAVTGGWSTQREQQKIMSVSSNMFPLRVSIYRGDELREMYCNCICTPQKINLHWTSLIFEWKTNL
jgi:hypothetical protein